MILTLREEIICVIISSFLLFYYHNQKIKRQGQSFTLMAIASILCSVFSAITLVFVNNQHLISETALNAIHYIFYVCGTYIGYSFFMYAVKSCKTEPFEIIIRWCGHVSFAFYILSLGFFPIYYIDGMHTNYSDSIAVQVSYFLFLTYLTAGIVLLCIYQKRVSARLKGAIFPMAFVLYILAIVQIVQREFLIAGASATLLCLSVFVAMDNPEKKYEEWALWDFLTGLKNRNCYERELEKYAKLHEQVGILVADVNNLKKVNDTFGHDDGDKLIITAANILKECLSSASAIYRIGGDEFVAIFTKSDESQVRREMKNVVARCNENISFAYPVSIAMGYWCGEYDIYETIKQADKNMYENKIAMKKQQ